MRMRWGKLRGLVAIGIASASLALSGCRLLNPTPPLAIEPPQQQEQFILHCDFQVPSQHRLLRKIATERETVAQTLNLPPCDEPIHVHLFRNGDTFADYVQLHFPKMPDRRAFFMETDTRLIVYAHWSDRVAEDLRHEMAHGYLHASVGNLPLWLDEGLAEYFEVPRAQQGVNQPHVELLMQMQREGWQPDMERLTKLDDFATMTQKDYAESWAWIHYLLESNPAERELLQRHLARLRRNGIAEPLFVDLNKLHHAPEQNLLEHLQFVSEEAKSPTSTQR